MTFIYGDWIVGLKNIESVNIQRMGSSLLREILVGLNDQLPLIFGRHYGKKLLRKAEKLKINLILNE